MQTFHLKPSLSVLFLSLIGILLVAGCVAEVTIPTTTTTIQLTTTSSAPEITTTTTGAETTTTINLNAAESCQDAEGDNIYVFGVSTIKYVSGTFSNFSDYCSDSKNLVEYYCNVNSLDIKNIVCDYTCSGGVCPQSGSPGTPICTDTGAGIKLRSGLNHTDSCRDDTNMKDYYCLSADIPAARIVTCQHGCNNTKCNPPPLGPPDISVSYKEFGYSSSTKILTLNYTISVANPKNDTLIFHTISDLFKGGRVEGSPTTSCVNQTTIVQTEGSYSSSCSISLNETGAYAVRITVDYLSKIAESNENNNVDISAITVA